LFFLVVLVVFFFFLSLLILVLSFFSLLILVLSFCDLVPELRIIVVEGNRREIVFVDNCRDGSDRGRGRRNRSLRSDSWSRGRFGTVES
jgi:hypothetical protein